MEPTAKGEESLTIDDSDHSSNSTPTDKPNNNANADAGKNGTAVKRKSGQRARNALPATGDNAALAATSACIAGITAAAAGLTLVRKRNK